MSLDDRLRNWGRWARGGLKLQTCGSAEGRYRSNWRQWIALSDIAHAEPIDIFDAEEIELAWSGLADFKEKKFLKLLYIFRCDKERVMQRCRIKTLEQFDVIHSRSRHHITQALDKSSVLCQSIDKFDLLPVTVEA